jgi:hypothetical protein
MSGHAHHARPLDWTERMHPPSRRSILVYSFSADSQLPLEAGWQGRLQKRVTGLSEGAFLARPEPGVAIALHCRPEDVLSGRDRIPGGAAAHTPVGPSLPPWHCPLGAPMPGAGEKGRHGQATACRGAAMFSDRAIPVTTAGRVPLRAGRTRRRPTNETRIDPYD